MSRALYARTRREFYSGWEGKARESGLTEEEIERYIDESVREAQTLLDGKCPKCGAPMRRYAGGPQHGVSSLPGVWVMYRCSTQPPPGQRRDPEGCDFMLDLKEEVGGTVH